MKNLTKEEALQKAEEVKRLFGVDAADVELILEALTHPSYVNEHRDEFKDYDRLEFLGDGILNFVVGCRLFECERRFSAGTMTQLRAKVICREGLLNAALAHELSRFLIMGEGEEKTGGRSRESTLADVVEAIIGAVYISLGFDEAKNLVIRLFESQIEDALSFQTPQNPKGALQEKFQKSGKSGPSYRIIHKSGSEHQPHFVVGVYSPDGELLAKGEGNSRKAAEAEAAQTALKTMAQK